MYPDKFQIYAKISTTNNDIEGNLNEYVGGIFVQKISNITSANDTYHFYKAVECDDQIPNEDSNTKYLCADTENIQLQAGMEGQDQQILKEFYYVVNSCQSMNWVYEIHFGEVWSQTC